MVRGVFEYCIGVEDVFAEMHGREGVGEKRALGTSFLPSSRR
jgi:hypothetical protein